MLTNILIAIGIFISIMSARIVFFKVILNRLQIILNKYDKTNIALLSIAIRNPINLLFVSTASVFALKSFELSPYTDDIIAKIFHSSVLIAIFWAILNSSPFIAKAISSLLSKTNKNIRVDINKFIETIFKVFFSFIGFAVLFQEWGYDISTLVASLGIGGLAFALAAKDTIANIFGYFIVFTESPFIVGDWVKIDTIEGTVETINIRSTKIRTFAQSLISIPNAMLTTSSIENFSKMGKRRIKMNIGLTYDTTQKQLQAITTQIKEMLKKDKNIDNDTIFVFFNNFSSSSLDIFCYFFTSTTNWENYLKSKENTYYKMMDILQTNNASFAFPTQSIYIQDTKNISK